MSDQRTDTPAADWHVFRGDGNAASRLNKLASPPPWRDFSKRRQVLADQHVLTKLELDAVNAALYLRRPLLVTGPPGSGKSSLAYAVARDFGLDPSEVLRWPINSRSTLADGLYSYDAIGRLRDAQLEQPTSEHGKPGERPSSSIGRYIRLNALGTALWGRPDGDSQIPRILLIDEIDKSDIDLPNDLLHVFEDGEFEIPELVRVSDEAGGRTVEVETADPPDRDGKRRKARIPDGVVRCRQFPFVILTSNRERDLPPAFFRRCLRLDLPQKADPVHLAEVVRRHLGEVEGGTMEQAIKRFQEIQASEDLVANDQLLNALYLVGTGRVLEADQRAAIMSQLLRALNR